MNITPEQELENAIIKVNYYKICDLLQLTEEQRLDQKAGEWICDVIKQFQTSSTLYRAMVLTKSETGNKKSPITFPTLPLVPSTENTRGGNDAGGNTA